MPQTIDFQNFPKLQAYSIDDIVSAINLLPFASYSTPHNQIITPLSSSRRGLGIKGHTFIRIDLPGSASGEYYIWTVRDDIVIPNAEDLLDTGTSFVAGKDYFVYLCIDDVQELTTSLKISLNTTSPMGVPTDSSRKIGGFHTLCASKGSATTYVRGGQTIDHELNGWLAGDILPLSFWDLKHRPSQKRTPQPGLTYERYLGFWVDIYLQSGTGVNAMSAYQGTIARNRPYVDFVEDMFVNGKRLLRDAEFAAAALGGPEAVAVAGANEAGATSGGAGGRSATNSQRIISYCGCEEMVGCLWQWLESEGGGGAVGSVYARTGGTDAAPTQAWQAMTTTAYGPYPQAGGKGSMWGLAIALLAGGGWAHSSGCGSRARSATAARSHSRASGGARGRGAE